MKIWVDADACPVVIKEILFRASERKQVELILVANHPIAVPRSSLIRSLQVSQGFDVADNHIAAHIQSGDLLISSDIPLAAEVIEKGALVLTPRGERHTANNIKARLNMRDFMETMRSSGVHTGGPAALNQTDRKAFADQLDRILATIV
ncbi:MAG: YaiI/YqxD family protein [bacterium]